MKFLLIFALSLVGGLAVAHASDCDPQKILSTNIENYKSNLAYLLSDVRSREENRNSKDNTGVGIAYEDYRLNYSEEKALSDYISEKTDFHMSVAESEGLLRTTLSPESVDAYKACLNKSSALNIYLNDNAANSESFVIRVSWRPTEIGPKPAKLSLLVSEGTVDGDTKSLMRPNEVREFTIHRQPSRSLDIAGSIDGSSDEIFLPPHVDLKVQHAELTDPPMNQPPIGIKRGDGAKTTDPITQTLCVTSLDGILLPESAMIQQYTEGPGGRTSAEIDKANSSVHRVCGRISASSPGKDVKVIITGRLRVLELQVQH